jgi:hypothetical protein
MPRLRQYPEVGLGYQERCDWGICFARLRIMPQAFAPGEVAQKVVRNSKFHFYLLKSDR